MGRPVVRLKSVHRLALVWAALTIGVVAAGRTAEGNPPATQAIAGPSDAHEIESFFDTFMPAHMVQWHTPGSACVVVRDGKILLAKGYGVADLAKQTPMQAEQTLIPIGSVTKLFTAVAVMQLAERGRLDFHTDVNHYLTDLQVDDPFPVAVTLTHLLTHSAAFDTNFLGASQRTPPAPGNMAAYLRSRHLTCTRPPGEMSCYSNDGVALAGHVVECVTGRRYEDYVQQEILTPLRMKRSVFYPEGELLDARTTRYFWDGGDRYRTLGDFYMRAPACGGLWCTPTDLAHFMAALVGGGAWDGRRILSPTSAQSLLATHFTNDPRLPGWGYDMRHTWVNGIDAIAQGGAWAGCAGKMMLVPADHVGIYVCFNRFDQDILDGVVAPILSHYYPAPPTMAATGTVDAARYRAMEGFYVPVNRSRSTFEKINKIYSPYELVISPAGKITLADQPLDYLEPNLFRGHNDQLHVLLRPASDGKPTYLFVDEEAYELSPWYEAPPLHWMLLKVFVAIFALAAVAWPMSRGVVAGYQLLMRRPVMNAPARFWAVPWLAAMTALLNVIFVVGFRLALKRIDPHEFMFGVPPVIMALLVIPMVTTAGTAIITALAVIAWARKRGTLMARLYVTAVSAVGAGFVPLLAHWNLLGMKF